MSTGRMILLTGCTLVLSGFLYAQSPEGMEYQSYGQAIGRQEQKGLQRQQVGNVTVLESNKEFSARSIDQLSQEVTLLAQEIDVLKNDVGQIKAVLNENESQKIDSANRVRGMFMQMQQQLNNLYDLINKLQGGSGQSNAAQSGPGN